MVYHLAILYLTEPSAAITNLWGEGYPKWVESILFKTNVMKTAKDYPTLSEIAEAQKKHEEEKINRFDLMEVEEE